MSDLLQTLERLRFPVEAVYDIGANKGLWTKKMKEVLPEARFFLFEANPRMQPPSFLDEDDQWISAVLSSPEMKKVDFYSVNGTGDSYYKEVGSVYRKTFPKRLSTTTLEEASSGLPLPDLIKMDTQGSELDILAGGIKALSYARIVMTETPVLRYNKGAPRFQDYIDAFGQLGFAPVGVEGEHYCRGALIHLDLIFAKNQSLTK